MKKFYSFIVAALLVAVTLTLTGCSTYGGIQKAFEKAGYKVSEDVEKYASENKAAQEEAEKEGIRIYFHVFTKSTTVAGLEVPSDVVVIVEFDCSEKEMEESETFKGLVKDAQKSDQVNGNCVLVAYLDKAAVDIFKNA